MTKTVKIKSEPKFFKVSKKETTKKVLTAEGYRRALLKRQKMSRG